MISNFLGKRIVVTGSGKGIGYEVAIKFLQKGASVIGVTRSLEDVMKLEDESKNFSGKYYGYVCDLSKQEDLERVSNLIIEKHSQIDVLVNNAGVRFRRPLLETSYQDFLHVMNNNVASAYFLTKKLHPLLQKSNAARVVNVASVAGVNGVSDLSLYSASKGAIISMTKSLSLEFASQGILVNCVSPGFSMTSFYEEFKQKNMLYEDTIKRTPLGRWATSSEIANGIIFLSSDESSYLTGHIMNIDGGWSAQ
jgi:Tropinone reductase 1